MRNAVTLRIVLALSVLLGSVVAGCRSMERTVNRVSNRMEQGVQRVTGNIQKTERKVFSSLPSQK